jgi:hypothetical protein
MINDVCIAAKRLPPTKSQRKKSHKYVKANEKLGTDPQGFNFGPTSQKLLVSKVMYKLYRYRPPNP